MTSMESRTEARITTFAKIGNAVEMFFDKLRGVIAYCVALDRVSIIEFPSEKMTRKLTYPVTVFAI